MLKQIFVLLAVATSVAFATTCGYCYPGYGNYVNSVGGVCDGNFYGSRMLNTGCATPVVYPGLFATPTYRATVGCPEVISSCENSAVSTGLYRSELYGSRYGLGCGSGDVLGGFRNGVIATAY